VEIEEEKPYSIEGMNLRNLDGFSPDTSPKSSKNETYMMIHTRYIDLMEPNLTEILDNPYLPTL